MFLILNNCSSVKENIPVQLCHCNSSQKCLTVRHFHFKWNDGRTGLDLPSNSENIPVCLCVSTQTCACEVTARLRPSLASGWMINLTNSWVTHCKTCRAHFDRRLKLDVLSGRLCHGRPPSTSLITRFDKWLHQPGQHGTLICLRSEIT